MTIEDLIKLGFNPDLHINCSPEKLLEIFGIRKEDHDYRRLFTKTDYETMLELLKSTISLLKASNHEVTLFNISYILLDSLWWSGRKDIPTNKLLSMTLDEYGDSIPQEKAQFLYKWIYDYNDDPWAPLLEGCKNKYQELCIPLLKKLYDYWFHQLLGMRNIKSIKRTPERIIVEIDDYTIEPTLTIEALKYKLRHIINGGQRDTIVFNPGAYIMDGENIIEWISFFNNLKCKNPNLTIRSNIPGNYSEDELFPLVEVEIDKNTDPIDFFIDKTLEIYEKCRVEIFKVSFSNYSSNGKTRLYRGETVLTNLCHSLDTYRSNIKELCKNNDTELLSYTFARRPESSPLTCHNDFYQEYLDCEKAYGPDVEFTVNLDLNNNKVLILMPKKYATYYMIIVNIFTRKWYSYVTNNQTSSYYTEPTSQLVVDIINNNFYNNPSMKITALNAADKSINQISVKDIIGIEDDDKYSIIDISGNVTNGNRKMKLHYVINTYLNLLNVAKENSGDKTVHSMLGCFIGNSFGRSASTEALLTMIKAFPAISQFEKSLTSIVGKENIIDRPPVLQFNGSGKPKIGTAISNINDTDCDLPLLYIFPLGYTACDNDYIDRAILTTTNPVVQNGCKHLVELIRVLLADYPLEKAIEMVSWTPEFESIKNVEKLSKNDLNRSNNVVNTLKNAIWCNLKHSKFIDVINEAISLSKDSNTVYLAGGIAAILYGIPSEIEKTYANTEEYNRVNKALIKYRTNRYYKDDVELPYIPYEE